MSPDQGTNRSETHRPGDLLRLKPGVGWEAEGARRRWVPGCKAVLIWGDGCEGCSAPVRGWALSCRKLGSMNAF